MRRSSPKQRAGQSLRKRKLEAFHETCVHSTTRETHELSQEWSLGVLRPLEPRGKQ